MNLAYLSALMRQSLKAASANRKRFAILAFTMFLNDLMFFLLWVVFFSGVKDIRGWTLTDVALFQGIVVAGFGTVIFFFKGTWHIARRIISGEMDIYLARPRVPLPQLMTMECDATALGDAFWGIVLLLTMAQLNVTEFALAAVTVVLIGLLFLAVVICLQSIAFFATGGSALADQLFETMICLGTIPQHTNGMVVKFILFTIVPAGFMAIMPVEIVHRHSIVLLAALAGAVGLYLAGAIAVFNLGLRRYTSATGWSA